VIAIRLARADDFSALVALDAVASGDVARREAIADWIALGRCHVATDEAGDTVGYVALTRSFFRSPFIEMLQVARAALRQGIGRALMRHCVALTAVDQKLWTSTNRSNTPMQAPLWQLGFVQAGTFEHLDPGDPELIYLRWPAAGGGVTPVESAAR
jgi:ribosomal protein S18 acetylase RimI-like enzyme